VPEPVTVTALAERLVTTEAAGPEVVATTGGLANAVGNVYDAVPERALQ
jgi:hypothetical protein